ncbi:MULTISPECIES: hypothetical protein [unclassified Frankia]|nr:MULTISPECIES: hypothetical protein [unclassified Frankia]
MILLPLLLLFLGIFIIGLVRDWRDDTTPAAGDVGAPRPDTHITT